MSHAEILIPFSLPPAEHARDLVKTLSSRIDQHGLAMLLARGHILSRQRMDDFSPLLPHEHWLKQQSRSTPLQQPLIQHLNHTMSRTAQRPEQQSTQQHQYWFMVNPVHLHIARNHLVLTDQRQLNLTETESRALFTTASALCQETGTELLYGTNTVWWLRATAADDGWSDFTTSSPDAACGHNIEIWSPKGRNELAWRKLQNEIQMEWFIHPINQQRELQGKKTINGLWLWGGIDLSPHLTPATGSTAGAGAGGDAETAPDSTPAPASAGTRTAAQWLQHPELLVLDQLSSSALASDWGTWLENWIVLEQQWFVALHAAVKSRQLPGLRLHLSNSNTLLSLDISSASLRRFWRTPSLKNLA